jgi:hypothetical protein
MFIFSDIADMAQLLPPVLLDFSLENNSQTHEESLAIRLDTSQLP